MESICIMAKTTNTKEQPTYSNTQIKRARMYINKNWAADDTVSADLMNYVKSLDTKTESPNTNLDKEKDEGLVITDNESTDDDDKKRKEIGQKISESNRTVTNVGTGDAGTAVEGAGATGEVLEGTSKIKNINLGKLSETKLAKKWRAGKPKRQEAMKKTGEGLVKGKSLVEESGVLPAYGLSKHLEEGDFKFEGVEDLPDTLTLGRNVTGVASKGMEYGSKLLKKAGKADKAAKWATKAEKLGKTAGNLGLGASVIGAGANLVDTYENIGGKGQDDSDVAAQLAGTASSALSAGVGIAAATGGTGAFATAAGVAKGAAAFGPVGWAIAGLTVLSMGLSDLF